MILGQLKIRELQATCGGLSRLSKVFENIFSPWVCPSVWEYFYHLGFVHQCDQPVVDSDDCISGPVRMIEHIFIGDFSEDAKMIKLGRFCCWRNRASSDLMVFSTTLKRFLTTWHIFPFLEKSPICIFENREQFFKQNMSFCPPVLAILSSS